MCCMTVLSVFVYFVFLLVSLVPMLENVPKIQQRSQVRQNPLKKSSTAGDNVTYHIPNRTDCNGPRLYQAYQ